MTADISTLYDAILKQMAAESYLEGVSISTDPDILKVALRQGNTRQGFDVAKGFTKFTDVQAAEFVAKYQIIAQASDFAGGAARLTTVPTYYIWGQVRNVFRRDHPVMRLPLAA